jgi:CheY-like chemotaxis protein
MLECEVMIEPQAQKRGIGMRFPRLPTLYFVKADRTRLKQVLINLLFNAVKYNKPEGTVAVDYALKPPHSVRISVRDTGEGLAPDKLAKLFQAFSRLGQEAGPEEGTGIGLVVTKRLVELMGGVIGVDSTVGTGSVFWFELSLTAAPQRATGGAEGALLIKPVPSGGAALRTLLYVEDNSANLRLVEELVLRVPGLRLLSAADGNLGIALAREYQPAVILMDINLPGISGIEAMKILRADPVTAHIPIIALSANAMSHDIENGLKAGFFRYLTKPIVIGEFMSALGIALDFSAAAVANADGQRLLQ